MPVSTMSHSRLISFHISSHLHTRTIPQLSKLTLIDRRSKNNPFISIKTWSTFNSITSPSIVVDDEFGSSASKKSQVPEDTREPAIEKSFWGAVSLIIGTAVGPGMLGLPAATIRSGPLPSTIAILVSWIYVISSIILVAELTFATMEEDGIEEVSFTGLATKALGSRFGAFVALVYASLSFSLLVACVSGIGSIVRQVFPWMNHVLAHALFPLAAGIVIGFFPFKVIDVTNRLLCFSMFFSITLLVTIGLSVARINVFGSYAYASWNLSSILPAIPITVLTLGFHVITPFICKIAGNDVSEARKAILIGGAVPLMMVLSWNLIILRLAGTNPTVSSSNPISLLLSVNPSALSAVQGFAFSALTTSFIGYTVSLPKQLVDTLELILAKGNSEEHNRTKSQIVSNGDETGKVGFVTYSDNNYLRNMGKVSFIGSRGIGDSEVKSTSSLDGFKMFITPLVFSLPILIASFFPSTF